MQCKQASEMMSARLDGRLDGNETALLEAHLAGCNACQAEWRKMQALDKLLSSASMVEAPVRVRVHVMTRLGRRDQARRAIIGGTTLTLGTVALALLVVAPVLLGLLNVTSIVPALIYGGPETLSSLLGVGQVMGHTYAGLAVKLVVPLAVLSLCGLTAMLVLNGIWVGAMHRLRTHH
jgi:predicted anti-sigma-YlaC factor YlaD